VNDASYIRPAIPATCQPIFEENMGLYEVLEVPVDTEKSLVSNESADFSDKDWSVVS